MISCQILGFLETIKVLFFLARLIKILLIIFLAANLQENSITPKEMIIYLTVQDNTQGNRYFPWRLRTTVKEIRHFLGGDQTPPRKHPYSLAVHFNRQGIYVSLKVQYHSQGNYIFLGGFNLTLKKIVGRQGNSSFL